MFRFEKGRAALNNNYLLPNPDKSMFHFMVELPLFQFIQVNSIPTRLKTSIFKDRYFGSFLPLVFSVSLTTPKVALNLAKMSRGFFMVPCYQTDLSTIPTI